jgi:aminoglycoside/choline kinase family phosphotransferase
MSKRASQITHFLRGSPWEHWDQSPLAGDASSRRYIRLSNADESAILMDADPAVGQSTDAFARIAKWLRENALSAPTIPKHNPNAGLMVLEDLGSNDLAQWIAQHPKDADLLYQTATDVLVTLDRLPAPANLSVMTPEVGGQMLDVTCHWYAHSADHEAIPKAMSAALEACCGAPSHVALRDYHAENLIWRPDRTGTDRIGLLDFQDAFIAPRGYDLVSLLRDVRRAVDPEIATRMTAYFAKQIGTSDEALGPGLACLAAQRNLRILGVFARLALRDGKHRYITMIPHLWGMITKDLDHPALRDLKAVVAETLPPPKHSAIKDLL